MMTCLMMAMETIMSEGTNVKAGFQDDGVGSNPVQKMQAHGKAQQPILRPGVGGVAHWEGVV